MVFFLLKQDETFLKEFGDSIATLKDDLYTCS